MRENVFKVIFVSIIGGISAYIGEMAIPIIVLLFAMIVDYVTGISEAWVNKTLNSKIGLVGIIKKMSYFCVVIVAVFVDWIIQSILMKSGINIGITYTVGIIVTIWLIINELISILENVAQMGIPIPNFLTSIIHKLKVATEEKTEINSIESGEK